MKETKIIHTTIGDLEIPREIRQLIRIKRGGDLGANLMEGWNEDMGFSKGYIAQKFNGRESKGRTPFTIKEIQDFIILCCQSPLMAERYSHLLIIIMGQIEA
jgi:hypothetical protein